MLRRFFVSFILAYSLAAAFLAYLGVSSVDAYVAALTIVYLASLLLHQPLPYGVRGAALAVAAVLVAALAFFAALRILAVLSTP